MMQTETDTEDQAAPAEGRNGLGGALIGLAIKIIREFGLVLILVAFVIVIAFEEPSFLSKDNLIAVAFEWAPVGIMAAAGTFVIIAGGFDLSVGGVFALSSVAVAALATDVPVPLAFAIAILGGLTVGTLNGLIITKGHVNSFIATFGTGQIYRGIALAATGATPVVVDSAAFGWLGQTRIGTIPITVFVLVAVLIVGGVVLAYTVYGRSIYAIGGNRESSVLSGLNADLLLISAFAVSGGAAALAGTMFASRIGQGQADLGNAIEFQVVTAIILGGTSLMGGSGAMWRTALGVTLLAVTNNGLNALAINPFYNTVIVGSILVGAVAWDEFTRRRTGNFRRIREVQRRLRRTEPSQQL
jgi:ribose transport system permease protein